MSNYGKWGTIVSDIVQTWNIAYILTSIRKPKEKCIW